MPEQTIEFTGAEQHMWVELCAQMMHEAPWFVPGRAIPDEELGYYQAKVVEIEAEATRQLLELRRRRDG